MPRVHFVQLTGPYPEFNTRTYGVYEDEPLWDIRDDFCIAFGMYLGSYQMWLRGELAISGNTTIESLLERGLGVVGEWAWPVELNFIAYDTVTRPRRG